MAPADAVSRIKQFYHERVVGQAGSTLFILFLIIGLSVRLRSYFAQISLWNDEAALATNIVQRTFLELFGPLDIEQVAPIGFSLITKAIVSVGGNHELCLRLIPFVAGTGALFLAYFLIEKSAGKTCALLCTAQLAVIKESIFYTNNFKPYASDLAIALGLTLIGWFVHVHGFSAKRLWILLMAGLIAVWCSFPAIFVLSGIAVILGFKVLMERDWRKLGTLTCMLIAWLANFAAQYYLLREKGGYHDLKDVWTRGFFVLLPGSLGDLKHNFYLFLYAFRDPVWTISPWISLPLFFAGCKLLWQRHRTFLFFIALPLLFNMIASGMHAYPFRDRIIQYAVIFLYAPIAFCLTSMIKPGSQRPWLKWIGGLVILANLAEPTINAVKHTFFPYKREEMKQVVLYLKKHSLPDDAIVVQAYGFITFDYYRHRFDLDNFVISLGVREETEQNLENEIGKLTGRVWLVFGHASQFKGVDYQSLYLKTAERQGNKVDQYIDVGASAYLYTFP